MCGYGARARSEVKAGASVTGEQPERGVVRWNGDVRRATAALEQLEICFTLSLRCETEQETGQWGVGWVGGGQYSV